MAHLDVRTDVSITNAVLVEGLPGVGLVGKIAADHLVESLNMTHYADVHCESLPRAATFASGDAGLRTPVRLYTDTERDLLVLQSDVPVSPAAATEFAECISGWFREESVVPLYIAGLTSHHPDPEQPTGESQSTIEQPMAESRSEREQPTEKAPPVFGVASGDGASILDRADILRPTDAGIVSGPTGALLNHALATDLTAVGLVAECESKSPNLQAAVAVLDDGIAPITSIDVPTEALKEQAGEFHESKHQLARQMHEEDEKASQAYQLRMFQ